MYQQVHGSPVVRLCYLKFSTGFLQRDLRVSYSFDKIQSLEDSGISQENT